MKQPLLFITALFAGMNIQAQYTFSTFTEDYASLENDTEIIENDYDENIWDDPNFMIDIGFSFPVNDQLYTTLSQEDLGAFLVLNNDNSSSIFAYYSDLIDAELETPFSPSTISYVTEGEAGSRILKVQYENCGFYDIINGVLGGEVSNRVNFQVWLYENGIFEMRFGTNSITDNFSAHDGPGPLIFLATEVDFIAEEFGYFALLTGNPDNPTLELDAPINEKPVPMKGNPSDGRVYKFTPTSVGIGSELSMKSLKLYPSKTEHSIFIEGLSSPNSQFHIADITGKMQMSGMVNPGEGIDVSKLRAGLYLFQIEGYANALKFVKM